MTIPAHVRVRPIATRDLQTSANSSQMTVLVSVKINDGVVMAADSASSFESGMVYQNADKIVNLMEGLPIGAMATGAGGIGNESIDTLMKDLRRRFSGADARHPDWALDPATYAPRCRDPTPIILVRGKGQGVQWQRMDAAAHLRLLRRQTAR